MKIIDLLNMISKGEELPKKIKYHNYEFRLYSNHSYKGVNEKVGFFDEIYFTELNDEVEIIEEDKKIEKLSLNDEYLFSNNLSKEFTREDRRLLDSNFKELGNKINEIIDVINRGD